MKKQTKKDRKFSTEREEEFIQQNPGTDEEVLEEDEEDAGIKPRKNVDEDLPGYPAYPPEEDIFSNSKEVDVDPEDPTKVVREEPEVPNENELGEPIILGDLDVPGSELDDTQEQIGTEDEENNYYSLKDNELEGEEPDEDESDTADFDENDLDEK